MIILIFCAIVSFSLTIYSLTDKKTSNSESDKYANWIESVAIVGAIFVVVSFNKKKFTTFF